MALAPRSGYTSPEIKFIHNNFSEAWLFTNVLTKIAALTNFSLHFSLYLPISPILSCVFSCVDNSYNKLLEQKEQLEQKYLHVLALLDGERLSKWQYVQQMEELEGEVKKLKTEVTNLKVKIVS